ncbi:type IV secretion system protein [Hydrogenophaga flava]|uniref:type IV secretion system protein n=1 Tax=Hydrogenophaga flava TaxID=65657 RepID=UPI0008264635|nr:type IV secretion system protein [Hydrogenophaga flava]
MFDLLAAKPNCTPLQVADFLGQMTSVGGFADALGSSGVMPQRYLNALSDASFYCNLRNYILYDSIVDKWMFFVVNNLSRVVLAMASAFVTIWVILAGLKLMSGANREPVLELLYRGAKIVLVLSLLTAMLGNTDTIIHTVLGLQNSITTIITGSDLGVDRLIDMNIAISQVMNMVVEDVTNTTIDQANKSGSMSIFAGLLGQSGPAILTSILALLSQIAIVFALMLAPLFIFFLLFKQTTNLFWSWSKFLLGTFISLCFLAIVSTIAMSASVSYGLTIMVSFVLNAVADAGDALDATPVQIGLGVVAEVLIGLLTNGGDRVDMSGATMRLGMMGALFATLIVAVPPLIMQMFNASLGYASNVMGSMGIIRPMGQPVGGGGAASPGASQQALPANGYQPVGYDRSGPAGASPMSNNQLMINRANSLGTGGADASLAPSGAPHRTGSLGLNAQGNPVFAQARSQQMSDEFRSGSLTPLHERYAGSPESAVLAGPNVDGFYSNGTNVSDATIKHYEQQGIPLGSGGLLGVDGGSVGGSRALAQAPAGAPAPGVAAPERVATAPAVSDTPMHAMPRGQMGAANRIT